MTNTTDNDTVINNTNSTKKNSTRILSDSDNDSNETNNSQINNLTESSNISETIYLVIISNVTITNRPLLTA